MNQLWKIYTTGRKAFSILDSKYDKSALFCVVPVGAFYPQTMGYMCLSICFDGLSNSCEVNPATHSLLFLWEGRLGEECFQIIFDMEGKKYERKRFWGLFFKGSSSGSKSQVEGQWLWIRRAKQMPRALGMSGFSCLYFTMCLLIFIQLLELEKCTWLYSSLSVVERLDILLYSEEMRQVQTKNVSWFFFKS